MQLFETNVQTFSDGQNGDTDMEFNKKGVLSPFQNWCSQNKLIIHQFQMKKFVNHLCIEYYET